MLNQIQKEVLKKLIEIDKKLPEGVSLTFAVDNALLLLDDAECEKFVRAIHALKMAGYVSTSYQPADGLRRTLLAGIDPSGEEAFPK